MLSKGAPGFMSARGWLLDAPPQQGAHWMPVLSRGSSRTGNLAVHPATLQPDGRAESGRREQGYPDVVFPA